MDVIHNAEEFRLRPDHNGEPETDFKKRSYMMIFQVQIDQFGFCGWVSISLPKNDKASHMIAKAQSSPEILISIIFLDL